MRRARERVRNCLGQPAGEIRLVKVSAWECLCVFFALDRPFYSSASSTVSTVGAKYLSYRDKSSAARNYEIKIHRNSSEEI